jgi:DNA-binding XRE family transcriptional regulator
MTFLELGVSNPNRYTAEGEPKAVRTVAITGEQIRAARGLLRWEQAELAKASGLSLETIKSIERRHGALMVRTSTLYALLDAFNKAGVEFLEAGNNGGAGVRFKHGPAGR